MRHCQDGDGWHHPLLHACLSETCVTSRGSVHYFLQSEVVSHDPGGSVLTVHTLLGMKLSLNQAYRQFSVYYNRKPDSCCECVQPFVP